jgi:hypothetical protein
MADIHVQLAQTIACPINLVRRHFLDMEHHARHPVHAAATFAVIEQSSTHCRYTQKTRLGPFTLREEARLELDGDDVVNRCVSGASADMVVRFGFRSVDGVATEVTADVRLPRTGFRRVIAPLLRRMLLRGFARALEEDRVDLEERGYPR